MLRTFAAASDALRAAVADGTERCRGALGAQEALARRVDAACGGAVEELAGAVAAYGAGVARVDEPVPPPPPLPTVEYSTSVPLTPPEDELLAAFDGRATAAAAATAQPAAAEAADAENVAPPPARAAPAPAAVAAPSVAAAVARAVAASAAPGGGKVTMARGSRGSLRELNCGNGTA